MRASKNTNRTAQDLIISDKSDKRNVIDEILGIDQKTLRELLGFYWHGKHNFLRSKYFKRKIIDFDDDLIFHFDSMLSMI